MFKVGDKVVWNGEGFLLRNLNSVKPGYSGVVVSGPDNEDDYEVRFDNAVDHVFFAEGSVLESANA